jgi:hypothetical protein
MKNIKTADKASCENQETAAECFEGVLIIIQIFNTNKIDLL